MQRIAALSYGYLMVLAKKEKAMLHRAAFDRRSKIIRGLGRSLNKFLQSAAGRQSGLFQKFMKPALLADAKKQSVAALALLAGANMDTTL